MSEFSHSSVEIPGPDNFVDRLTYETDEDARLACISLRDNAPYTLRLKTEGGDPAFFATDIPVCVVSRDPSSRTAIFATPATSFCKGFIIMLGFNSDRYILRQTGEVDECEGSEPEVWGYVLEKHEGGDDDTHQDYGNWDRALEKLSREALIGAST